MLARTSLFSTKRALLGSPIAILEQVRYYWAQVRPLLPKVPSPAL